MSGLRLTTTLAAALVLAAASAAPAQSRRRDRFNRDGGHDSVGAAQSTESPWRNWYAFDAQGVPRGWKGYDSLPVLDYANPAVKRAISAAEPTMTTTRSTASRMSSRTRRRTRARPPVTDELPRRPSIQEPYNATNV